MHPILSTKSPYDINRILSEAVKFFIRKEDSGEALMYAAIKETPKHFAGFNLGVDAEGIIADNHFIIEKKNVNKEHITKNINEGICTWLKLSKNEKFIQQ